MQDLIVFLAPGFEEIEAVTVIDYLRRAGAQVTVAAVFDSLEVESSHGLLIKADARLADLDQDQFKAVYLPGGLPGATNLASDARVLEWVREFANQGKLVAAICAAPLVFDRLGLLEAGKYTCYPGYEVNLKTPNPLSQPLVKSGQIWTGMGPIFTPQLALALIAELRGEAQRKEVEQGLLYPHVKEFDLVK